MGLVSRKAPGKKTACPGPTLPRSGPWVHSSQRVYEKVTLACVLRDPGCAFGDHGLRCETPPGSDGLYAEGVEHHSPGSPPGAPWVPRPPPDAPRIPSHTPFQADSQPMS